MSMSSEGPKFDPYFKWLGIPKREQPANHYRLLGVAMYESDAGVIEAAAQRQAKFIKGCGEKKFADVAERVIANIAAARACLVDPAAKAAYDEQLKAQQPKPVVAAPRKTRFDALMVKDVDTPLQLAEPEPEPVKELLPIAAEPVEESGELALKDDLPAPVPTPAPTPSKPAAPAPRAAASHKQIAPPPAAPLPPVTPAPAQKDVNTGTVIKLAVGGCILAGGVTVGLLMWLSSGKTPDTSASEIAAAPVTPKPATTAPAEAAPAAEPQTEKSEPAAAPKAQAATAPSQKPAAKPPATAPAANVPKPAAPAPKAPAQPAAKTPPGAPGASAVPPAAAPAAPAPAAPAPQPPASKLPNTTWQITSQVYRGQIEVHADGSLLMSGIAQPGTWKYENDMFIGLVGGRVMNFKLVSDREMTGQCNGMPARAVLGKNQVSAAPAEPAQPGRPQNMPVPPGAATVPPAAAAPGEAGDQQAAAQQTGFAFPFRSLAAFREAWVKGPDTTSIDYDPETRVVAVEGSGNLGGFQYKRPWQEIQLTLHAETITGQLEIEVNNTTLKFGTATALIRKPATVVITYDAANSRVIATVGTRQVARATVLDDKFLATLACELRCDGGKARMKIVDLRIKTQ